MGDPIKLLQEADKALSSASGGWSMFSNKESKLQDAAERYTAAAHAFRTAKRYGDAASAFEKAAKVHYGGPSNKALNEPDDAARCNDDASKQYRLAEMPDDAIRTLRAAAQHWYAKGNVTRAGQARGTLGEWLIQQAEAARNAGYPEASMDLYNNALKEFDSAAEYYTEDSKPALASKWRIKSAETNALLGGLSVGAPDQQRNLFRVAKDAFTSVAEESLASPTMKYSAKGHLFNACICSLASEDVNEMEMTDSRNFLGRCAGMDPNFASQPHRRFIEDLIDVMEGEPNVELFVQRLQEFQQGVGIKFENHQVMPLLVVKQAIQNKAEADFGA